jgi:hypothetical protein
MKIPKELKTSRKEIYEMTKTKYKPLYDAIKKQKKEDKKNGVYDLVTITDRFTGEEITKIHVGINLMDKGIKKVTKIIKERILWGK